MPEWNEIQMQSLMINAEDIDAYVPPKRDEALRSPRDFLGKTTDIIKGIGSDSAYYSLPFPTTQGTVKLKKGKISLIAGYNGSKKSMVAGQIVLNLARQGAKSCIASFEMYPHETLERLAYQAIGNQNPKIEVVNDFFMWLCWGEKLSLFDHLDMIEPERVLNLVRYCGEVLKMGFIVIDSLMMINIEPKDTGAQKRFGLKLSAICKITGIHAIMVVHMRKPPHDNFRWPTRYDILGASEISNIANNIFICLENPKKIAEEIKREAQRVENWEKMPDHFLITEKQRGDKFEKNTPLWFNDSSMQLLDNRHARPYEYWKHFKEGIN